MDNGVNFDGQGFFKFALVNAAGSVTYWSNDNTSVSGGEPTQSIEVTVTGGCTPWLWATRRS